MNKYSIITVIAIVVIAISFALSGFSVLGAHQLEYRWHSPGEFSFFKMSNHGEVEFCNTLPFWVTIEKFEVATFYRQDHLGSFVVDSITINPLSPAVQKGTFSSDELTAVQANFMALDYQFDGGEMRLDPSKFFILVNTSTPILGIIPYSTTLQTTGFEFDELMKTQDLACN